MTKQTKEIQPDVNNLEGLLEIFGALQSKVIVYDLNGDTYPYTVRLYTDDAECKFTYYDRNGLEIPTRYQEIEDGILKHLGYIKERPATFPTHERNLLYYYLLETNNGQDLRLHLMIVNDEYIDAIMSMPFIDADAKYLMLNSREPL